MTTPIFDFAQAYARQSPLRLHMPGHKGVPLLGCEPLDLTEITGADDLYAPEGIIAESEANTSLLFGCRTLFSAEGSSLCIRAMLYLAMLAAREQGRTPVIAAPRNAHKTFLTAAALLDFPVHWLPSGGTYLSAAPLTDALDALLSAEHPPTALYLTTPDYLGHMADIDAAARFCHAHGMLLLVDCAHGAYLRFLPQDMHPMTLGADLCCDSAHKTLPVLTGGAYLHIRENAPAVCGAQARQALALFGSTSPSYLILQSLDLCNRVLSEDFPARLAAAVSLAAQCRERLTQAGWTLTGDEPMKLTLCPKAYGYRGTELASILEDQRIYVEFADPDYLVLMPSPYTTAADLERLTAVLCAVPRRAAISEMPPALPVPQPVMSPREAMFAPKETLPLAACIGRICAEITVSCPPAVPIVLCGERVTAEAISAMAYYGVRALTVIK